MADRIRRVALAAIALPLLFLAQLGLARASTITVTSLSDTGAIGICVLRDAITAANSMTATNGCAAGSGTDSIVFEPGLTGTIALGSTLPPITDTSLSITGPTGSPGITISGGGSVAVMSVQTGTTNLQNLTIAHGSVPLGSGGGIFNSGTLTVTNCTFSDNTALGGGGIFSGGTLTITNSTFSDNNTPVGGSGGGIFNGGELTITNSTFSDNTADDGGGIFNGGPMTIINSTFSDNTASADGGGIFDGGPMTITNSTFSDNSAADGGGIWNGGPSTLKSTILAGESDGGNCGGTIGDAGYNIADDGSCMFTALTSINNSTALNLDPAGLQNNGGPTQTVALELNSKAVDFIPVADCTDQSMSPVPLTTDQRGFARPDSGNLNFCDAGAFELDTESPPYGCAG